MSTHPRRAQRHQGPPDAAPTQALTDAAPDAKPAYPRLTPLGKGLRWYDLPYTVLQWVHQARWLGGLPPRWRDSMSRRLSFMFQTHHARELRARKGARSWDLIELPDNEQIHLPAVWVAEYFTASTVHRLYDAIHRSGWNSQRTSADSASATELASSRSGRGLFWWRIADGRSLSMTPGVHRTALPPGVDDISIMGISVGTGVTAVVVSFTLDQTYSDRLNATLRFDHEAAVIRRAGQIPVAQGPKPVLHHRLQQERARIHRQMRDWTARSLPGVFAESSTPQPLFDLVFFDAADPFANDTRRQQRDNDALRGIGVDGMRGYQVASRDLPGLELELPSRRWAPDVGENVWTLWGNTSSSSGLASDKGGPNVRGAAFNVGEELTDFIARTGLTALLRLLQKTSSLAHDNARRLHGGTSSRDLKRLRERTLTTSLDLATLEEDVKTYNGRGRRGLEPQFFAELLPPRRSAGDGPASTPRRPADFNKNQRREQKKLARDLVAFDAGYRDVLNTVAALGASLDSRRVQRVAVWVSVASLGVAVVTLWATSRSAPDVVQVISDLMGSWFA